MTNPSDQQSNRDYPGTEITDAAGFGRALALRRKSEGLTQAGLAGSIGVDRRVIGQLERGKQSVQLSIALSAARAVGLDMTLQPR